MLSMTSHGSMLMKPPVYHKRCRVVIFLGELAVATQHYCHSRDVPVLATKDGEEEDEVEDPHDDAEVSECEEDGNVPATEEDKAADPDEFDDGF